jgi:hypothetical protein
MELEYQKQQQDKLNEKLNKNLYENEEIISDDEILEYFDGYDSYDDYENDINSYQNGCIYRIYCKDTNIKDEYNGSTDNFNRRKQRHKNRCNNNTNSIDPSFYAPVYLFMRKHGGWDNWIMEKLYDYPCNSENELSDEEDKYVRNNLNATLQGKKVKLTIEEKTNYQKLRYHAMTLEQKKNYLEYQREKKRIRKENETEEEKKKRLENERNKYHNMEDDEKRQFLDKQKKYKKKN